MDRLSSQISTTLPDAELRPRPSNRPSSIVGMVDFHRSTGNTRALHLITRSPQCTIRPGTPEALAEDEAQAPRRRRRRRRQEQERALEFEQTFPLVPIKRHSHSSRLRLYFVFQTFDYQTQAQLAKQPASARCRTSQSISLSSDTWHMPFGNTRMAKTDSDRTDRHLHASTHSIHTSLSAVLGPLLSYAEIQMPLPHAP
ncbi:hypothetical protein BDP55DRAFT_626100 [Colletotrichum godetiae]|uniref:Uncharacterized protein n=1 Tax=Colletotrichum godetiae TaxID=1209918 RepID=A0AAJ0AZV2_9PEZI|nr:uncharacterized protein BDP55DRAFT_626100 [Colletotrichum godetiae]KAK1700535.1 hypothetical protein BDP55DRAFT_626100 [Colletotrichum godetiae]